jgi:hypothetical protein
MILDIVKIVPVAILFYASFLRDFFPIYPATSMLSLLYTVHGIRHTVYGIRYTACRSVTQQ